MISTSIAVGAAGKPGYRIGRDNFRLREKMNIYLEKHKDNKNAEFIKVAECFDILSNKCAEDEKNFPDTVVQGAFYAKENNIKEIAKDRLIVIDNSRDEELKDELAQYIYLGHLKREYEKADSENNEEWKS